MSQKTHATQGPRAGDELSPTLSLPIPLLPRPQTAAASPAARALYCTGDQAQLVHALPTRTLQGSALLVPAARRHATAPGGRTGRSAARCTTRLDAAGAGAEQERVPRARERGIARLLQAPAVAKESGAIRPGAVERRDSEIGAMAWEVGRRRGFFLCARWACGDKAAQPTRSVDGWGCGRGGWSLDKTGMINSSRESTIAATPFCSRRRTCAMARHGAIFIWPPCAARLGLPSAGGPGRRAFSTNPKL